MENLKIHITREDIDEYLLSHKISLKYKEALFMRYLDDTDDKTWEKTEMLLPHVEDKQEFYKQNRAYDLFTFDRYIELVTKYHILELEDICLVLIPALGLNDRFFGEVGVDGQYNYKSSYIDYAKLLEKLVKKLQNYSKEYADNKTTVKKLLDLRRTDVFNRILDSYLHLKEIGVIKETDEKRSLIGKTRCEEELDYYSSVYGEEPVQIIKNYARDLK